MYTRCVAILLILFSAAVVGAEENTIRLTNSQNEWHVPSSIPWISSDNSQFDASQALTALKNTPASKLPKMSSDVIWQLIPFETSLPFDVKQSIWISKTNAFLYRYNLYLFDGNNQLLQTDSLGIGTEETYQRPAVQRQTSRFTVEGHQQYSLVIEILSSTPLGNRITLRSEQYFQKYVSQEWLIVTVMVTLLLAMFVFNTVIFFGYPDRAYFWFLIFHVALFIYISSTYGFGHHFFPPAVIEFTGIHVMVINFTLLILLFLFSHYFLMSFDNKKWQKYGLNHERLLTLMLIGLLASFVLPDHIMLPFFLGVQTLVIVIIGTRSAIYYYKGFRPALLLLISLIIQSIGASINVASFMYLIPQNVLTEKAFFISSIIELLVIAYAISVKTRYLEKEKVRLGQIDSLTGVVNMAYIESTFTKEWSPLINTFKQMAIIDIRFTGFEDFSRAIGPAEADNLVKIMVEQLDRNLANVLGAVKFPGTKNYLCAQTKKNYLALATSDNSIEQVISNLKSLTDRIIDRQNQTGSIDIRMGYYHCFDNTETFDEALRKSMVAMTLAESKTERVSNYDSSLDEQFKLARLVKKELNSAIRKGELKAYVQPQINIQSNEIIGAEVLIRWFHPKRGFISPSMFIPLTEQLNLVTEVSRFVLSETYQYLNKNPMLNMSFSVNLSAKDLMVDGFVNEVKKLNNHYDIGKNKIRLEITESSLIERPEFTLKSINELKDIGLPIAIDDFGTGYSSLTYLSQIRPDEVKIDQSFVRVLMDSKIDQDIVESIIKLSYNMNATCIAEGVENNETVEKLLALGCKFGQGFYWSAPMPMEDFIYWVHEYKKSAKKSTKVSA